MTLVSPTGGQAEGLRHSSRGHRPRGTGFLGPSRPVRALQFPLPGLSLSQAIPSYPNVSQQFLEKIDCLISCANWARHLPPFSVPRLPKAIEAYSNLLKGIFKKIFFPSLLPSLIHPLIQKIHLFRVSFQPYSIPFNSIQAYSSPPRGGGFLYKLYGPRCLSHENSYSTNENHP
jgi:hypothetical protein